MTGVNPYDTDSTAEGRVKVLSALGQSDLSSNTEFDLFRCLSPKRGTFRTTQLLQRSPYFTDPLENPDADIRNTPIQNTADVGGLKATQSHTFTFSLIAHER